MRTERTTSQTTRTTKPAAVKAAAKPAAKPRASRAKKPSAPPAETHDMATTVPAVTATTVVITDEMIAVRAYEIFIGRNGADGDAASDWAQAERELRGQ